MKDLVAILNITIHNISTSELLERLGQDGGVVYTPNIDHLSKLQHDHDFLRAYRSATYRVCDSQVLMYASRLLGCPIREKISGSDLLPAFCEYYRNDESQTLFLLGAMEGVAVQAQQRINQVANREMVVGCYSPPFGFEHDEDECEHIVEMVNRSGATALVVGLGAPKQETWIYRYKYRFPHVKVFLAVGAAIDFEAGHRQRSPKWMSQLGLEWLHRLMAEPARLWKRYLLEDIPVLGLLAQQRFNCYTSPFNHRQTTSSITVMLRDTEPHPEQQFESASKSAAFAHLRSGQPPTQKGWLNRDLTELLKEHRCSTFSSGVTRSVFRA